MHEIVERKFSLNNHMTGIKMIMLTDISGTVKDFKITTTEADFQSTMAHMSKDKDYDDEWVLMVNDRDCPAAFTEFQNKLSPPSLVNLKGETEAYFVDRWCATLRRSQAPLLQKYMISSHDEAQLEMFMESLIGVEFDGIDAGTPIVIERYKDPSGEGGFFLVPAFKVPKQMEEEGDLIIEKNPCLVFNEVFSGSH